MPGDGIRHRQVPARPSGGHQEADESPNASQPTLSGSTGKGEPTLVPCSWQSQWPKWFFLFVFTVLAIATRLHSIALPTSVAWDETHFGKFANHYILGTFYFDVHPPLAKMLIAAAGYLTGYDGQFEFKQPGDAYGETSYIGMRVFCAISGALCVPLAYMTVWELVPSLGVACVAATVVLCETSFITVSRFILLDPILMFFIQASVFAMFKFSNCNDVAFSLKWWFWLETFGVCLGGALSCKWVGAFVVAFAGIHTVVTLWALLGDLRLSLADVGKHFVARVVGLIVTPLAVYLFVFYLHLCTVKQGAPGMSLMSTAFQTTLEGDYLHSLEGPEYIAYGSVISLRSQSPGVGLLHSHPHLFPAPLVEQQQITCYGHLDDNNLWVVKHAKPVRPGDLYINMSMEEPLEFVRSGDRVRLEHVLTRRNLHSHNEKAPVTEFQRQVTAYGNDGIGDIHDEWVIQLVGGGPGDKIGRIDRHVRLLHGHAGHNPDCALHADGTQLPEWGFSQSEVTCNPYMDDEANMWNIELHHNPRLPNSTIAVKAPSFLAKVFELHKTMLSVNNKLVPKKGERPSQPWEWPITWRGQKFTGWRDQDRRVMLLGNPIIFFSALGFMSLFVLAALVAAMRRQRALPAFPWGGDASWTATQTACFWLLAGWGLHYLPFYTMPRVLYFHHYMPAHLFSCMFLGVFLDYLARTGQAALGSGKRVYLLLLIVFTAGSLFAFTLFRSVAYGMVGPLSDVRHLEWNRHWELTV